MHGLYAWLRRHPKLVIERTRESALLRAFSAAASGRIVLSVPYAQLALYALVSACAGLLAAIMPARRAARTSVVTAMTDH